MTASETHDTMTAPPAAASPQAPAPQPLARRRWRRPRPTNRRSPATRGVGGSILHGASWNMAAELAPVVVNITLTPFLIHGLGIQQYGIYALAATITIFLNSFDGGLSGAAQRYFSVNAGRDDQVANTRLLCSLALVILVGGGVLSGADFFAAPWLSQVFHLPHRYQLDAIFLLRTFGILVTVSMLVGLITSLLQAHQRFGLTSKMRVASYLAWAGGLYLTVVEHAGLKGVALSLIAEQLIAALVLPATARHLTRSSFGLLSWAELRPILRFGGSVQARGLTSLVNTQFDAIIVGAVLPVAFVGLYNAGANPATQLFYVSLAAVSPIWTHLARVFGESGEAAARVEMARAQRLWVTAISGFAAAEVGASFFAVEAWLGHRFETSAWVTVLLLGAYGFTLLASVLTYYTIAIGRPGIQVRAGVLGMIANVVLTVPLAFLGVLPVVAATAVGQIVSAVYVLRRARRDLGAGIPNFLRDIPVLRCALCGAVTVGLELVIAPIVPAGPLGLVTCGLPAAVALVIYGVSVLGARRTAEAVRTVVSERSLRAAMAGTPLA